MVQDISWNVRFLRFTLPPFVWEKGNILSYNYPYNVSVVNKLRLDIRIEQLKAISVLELSLDR